MDPTFGADDWVRHGEAMRRIAQALLPRGESGEDVVQSAYLAALERPPRLLSRRWLERVVRNRAVDQARRSRPHAELPEVAEPSAPGPADVAQRLELHRALVESVDALGEPYRTTLYMRYFEGLTPVEIARRTGTPPKTVKTRLARGLDQLRARLARRFGSGHDGLCAALAVIAAPRGGVSVPAAPSLLLLGGLAVMWKKIALVAALALVLFGVVQYGPWREAAEGPATAVAPTETPMEPAEVVEEELATAPAEPRAVAAEEPLEEAEAPVAAPTSGSLLVRVRSSEGARLAGVTIDVRTGQRGLPIQGLARVVTDAEGNALAQELRPGPVRLTSDRGDMEEWVTAEVVAGEETVVDFSLAGGLGVLGRVVDGEGQPVEGASVWVSTGQTDWQGGNVRGLSDGDGRFLIETVAAGASIGAFAEDYAPSKLVDLDELDTSEPPVEVQLVLEDAGGSLRGVVVDPAGEPVADALICVGRAREYLEHRTGDSWIEHWTPRVAHSDEQGRFAFVGLEPGAHPVWARSAVHATWKGSTVIRAAEVAEVRIELTPGFSVSGIVRDAEGEPIAGARLRGFDALPRQDFLPSGQFDYAGSLGYAIAVSDEHGRFRMERLSPGTAYLYASEPPPERGSRRGARMRAETELTGDAGEELSWDPVIEEGPTIRGVVTYKDGFPMEWVFVSARNQETGTRYSLTTDKEGHFSFFNLKPAPYTLGVQFWFPPEGAEPLEAQNVWPSPDVVPLEASFDKPVEEEPAIVRGHVDDAAERLVGTWTVTLDSDKNFSKVNPNLNGNSFEFDNVAPGRYCAVVLAGETAVYRSPWIDVEAGEVYELGDLITEPAAAIDLVLERDDLTRDVEIRVWSTPVGTIHGESYELGTDSTYALENLSSGPYRLSLYGDGIMGVSETVELAAGERKSLTLKLDPGTRVRYEIDWPGDAAMGPLSVRIVDAAGEKHSERGETNVNALRRPYVRTATLPLGSYTLIAETESGLKGSAKFEVGSYDASEIEPIRCEMR